jgi:endo-alpha-1,4-polygalactosaminidase (GH114 family)
MTLRAKPVLKDKFWIVENNGEKVGTMSYNEEQRYMFSSAVETCFFDNTRQMKKRFGVDIEWGDAVSTIENATKSYEVHGYPTSVQPFNALYDVKQKLPLFTKSAKSKSLYCAGYYISSKERRKQSLKRIKNRYSKCKKLSIYTWFSND